MDILKKISAPLIIALSGLIVLGFGFSSGQLPLFKFGAFVFLLVGVVAILSSLDVFNKTIRTVILFALLALSAVLAYLDYMAIKEPLDFEKEKNRRYQYVIQNLKDLRQAELAYKSEYGKFVGDIDSLINFIKTDSLSLIKSDGVVPDGMTLIQAVDSGYMTIDTARVPAAPVIFDAKYLSERKVPFSLDSMDYVPFSTEKFLVEAAIIERGKVKVPVFLITDMAPFDKTDVLMVGSLLDPSTSGNWGE